MRISRTLTPSTSLTVRGTHRCDRVDARLAGLCSVSIFPQHGDTFGTTSVDSNARHGGGQLSRIRSRGWKRPPTVPLRGHVERALMYTDLIDIVSSRLQQGLRSSRSSRPASSNGISPSRIAGPMLDTQGSENEYLGCRNRLNWRVGTPIWKEVSWPKRLRGAGGQVLGLRAPALVPLRGDDYPAAPSGDR